MESSGGFCGAGVLLVEFVGMLWWIPGGIRGRQVDFSWSLWCWGVSSGIRGGLVDFWWNSLVVFLLACFWWNLGWSGGFLVVFVGAGVFLVESGGLVDFWGNFLMVFVVLGCCWWNSGGLVDFWWNFRSTGGFLVVQTFPGQEMKARGSGLYHDHDGNVLEVYSDSDWAAHKGNRKSVSSVAIFYRGCLIYSASRTQKVISLSSAEAELHAAASSTCDSIFISMCLEFLSGEPMRTVLCIDNSAARQILQ